MTIVYRAHQKSTGILLENDQLPLLVESVASHRHTSLDDYEFFSSNGGSNQSPLGQSLMDMVTATYNLHVNNLTLRGKLKEVLSPDPEYFDSHVTMTVVVEVEGLNMIHQNYNPQTLLKLATSDEADNVCIHDIVVDNESAIDQFGNGVAEPYTYEPLYLTEQQCVILGEEYIGETLIDPSDIVQEVK